MVDLRSQEAVAYDMLAKLGGKWAVLMSMTVALVRNGAKLPPDIKEKLALAHVKIGSGCFSCCEVSCALAEVESQLSSQFHTMEDEEFTTWQELLRDSMQGKLDYDRIIATPALEPVRNDCGFLNCNCG